MIGFTVGLLNSGGLQFEGASSYKEHKGKIYFFDYKDNNLGYVEKRLVAWVAIGLKRVEPVKA